MSNPGFKLVLILCLLGWPIVANLGFCFTKFARPSDELYIIRAANHSLAVNRAENERPYASAKDLQQQNPNCCSVSRFSGLLTVDVLVNRLLGNFYVITELRYQIVQKGVTRTFEEAFFVNACGAVTRHARVI